MLAYGSIDVMMLHAHEEVTGGEGSHRKKLVGKVAGGSGTEW